MAAFQAGIDFRQLMRSGQFSDLTLVCQGQEFKIHKLVACPQSPVFAAAVKGEFKYQEAKTGVIQIELFDAETVRRMVEFLYTGNYDSISPEQTQAVASTPRDVKKSQASLPADTTGTAPPAPAQDTLHHVRVNAIADYYGIKGLTLLANQKFQQAYQNKWDAKAFVGSAKEALGVTGDKSLHRMMALLVAQNMKELLGSGQLSGLVGDFAVEILRYQAKKLATVEREQSQRFVQQQMQLEARCQAAEARLDRVTENIGKLVATMCERDFCRNGACGGDFGCYIEQVGEELEPAYVLRCSWCRCRHP
ncbi:hypothetical protein Trco_000079 [Trichoderma cornu-damae]|uniref:BTB domain-containing protein n=1 Tax=Trichoderma cornu-damae TaxID=654480 RepID=A0A9P8U009_9HYPO|nr:hypothetical protein Trco_000079 [Trichoderma cornu-damae]